MNLQEFIEQTIREVTSSLHNASKEMIDKKTGRGIPDHKDILVSFDVAVTVDARVDKKANAGINVLGSYLSIGAEKKSGEQTQHVSRIKFDVPVRIDTIKEPAYSIA